jgi:hypothetical protein
MGTSCPNAPSEPRAELLIAGAPRPAAVVDSPCMTVSVDVRQEVHRSETLGIKRPRALLLQKGQVIE